MCGTQIDFKTQIDVTRPVDCRVYSKRICKGVNGSNSVFCNRLIQHSFECSACLWEHFPTFRLLGFIIFFHTAPVVSGGAPGDTEVTLRQGGKSAYKQYADSLNKFVNVRLAWKYVLENKTDPNVAQIVSMYRHLLTLAYGKMFLENFGTPTMTKRDRIFENRVISGFCPDVIAAGKPVYLVNLTEGTPTNIIGNDITKSLKHFYDMDYESAMQHFKSILDSFSICKKSELNSAGNLLYFDYMNFRFELKSSKSTKRSKSPTSYPNVDGRRKLRRDS